MSEDPERPIPESAGLDPDAAIQRRLIRQTPPSESTPGNEDSPGAESGGSAGDRSGDGAAAGAPDRDGPPDGTGAPDGASWPPGPGRAPTAPIIDTRRYQWMIGAVGLAVLIAFSVYLFVKGGNGTPGIGAGQRLPRFVAPLATANIDASANAHPVCNRARPAVRGLNVCDRKPIVLAFFTQGAKPCIQEVTTLQQVSHRYPKVQFAAVAVNVGHQAAAKLVRQHGWTIPVAYDNSGVLGQVFGVEICPLIEVARGNGIIARRLIGEHWISADNLASVVAKLDH